MKIAVLSRNPRLYSTRRLVEAGQQRGHEVVVIDTLRAYMNIASHKPQIHYRGKPLDGFDAVIPRIGASVTFYGCAVLRQFEMQGVFPLNESVAIARSRAKREQFNEEQTRKDVAREAAMAFERLEGADERLTALGDSLIANDVTRDLVLERYKLSRGDLIDVLQAENDYFEAGVAYVIALSGRDMAGYALMEHTGDLLRLFSPQTDYETAIFEATQ